MPKSNHEMTKHFEPTNQETSDGDRANARQCYEKKRKNHINDTTSTSRYQSPSTKCAPTLSPTKRTTPHLSLVVLALALAHALAIVLAGFATLVGFQSPQVSSSPRGFPSERRSSFRRRVKDWCATVRARKALQGDSERHLCDGMPS